MCRQILALYPPVVQHNLFVSYIGKNPSIHSERMRSKMEDEIAEEQAQFRDGRETRDQRRPSPNSHDATLSLLSPFLVFPPFPIPYLPSPPSLFFLFAFNGGLVFNSRKFYEIKMFVQ